MKQLTLNQEPSSHLSICEWYQREKESFSLSSPERPKFENTMNYSFRQTSFPKVLDKANKS
ncbi:hypothetical protein AWH56_024690 [Anaerobacillus isosaccharinicus]|uniref:Uncharacterized protein n=1 Tax=Anaerobacillus isosaccharinicus TaxID=1532552 RepID=A0A1S2KVR3_9BACI|nr:hypothetical protein [Anaerobacillus isosaccharinicus]MBA5585896.1 hypothetical protein [Anaerobacillus isosaccharinicus]QOY35814.1 hypothetical protein AWH56_024690 [Anaerobacillus isosaccharinicus]